MKKYIAVLLLFAILGIKTETASAQIRIGAKGAVDLFDHKVSSDMLKIGNKNGFQIGGIIEYIYPPSGFGADVALLYGRKKYDVDTKAADASVSDYNYISIPVNLKQRIKLTDSFGLFVSGGVYGDVKISGGDWKQKIENATKEYKAKNFMFGLNAGAGVTIMRHLDVGIYFRGELTEKYGYEYMDAETFQNKKFQTWSIGASYYF